MPELIKPVRNMDRQSATTRALALYVNGNAKLTNLDMQFYSALILAVIVSTTLPLVSVALAGFAAHAWWAAIKIRKALDELYAVIEEKL